jgi:streptogramin lyase
MRGWAVGAAVAATGLVFVLAWLTSRQQKTWTTHPVGVKAATMYRLQLTGNPEGLVAMKDGGVFYFVRGLSNVGQIVGRVTADGTLLESVVPSRDDISSIALGPDGAVWGLVDVDGAPVSGSWPRVGLARVSPERFELVNQMQIFGPGAALQLGPDHMFWYAFPDHHSIATSRTSGPPRTITLGHTATPNSLAFDAQGHLFASSGGQSSLSIIAASDQPTTLTLARAASTFGALAAGPEGDVWFTDPGANAIGRVTAARRLEEFPISQPLGPGGAVAVDRTSVWFAMRDGLGRFSKSTHAEVMVTLPETASSISSIVVAKNGTVWAALQDLHGGNPCLEACGGIVRIDP